MNNMAEYKTKIGIEVHCELKTNSKMFSDSLNNYGTVANTNINLIDFALPGTLPTVNLYGIELGLKAALALNSKSDFKVNLSNILLLPPSLEELISFHLHLFTLNSYFVMKDCI